MQMKAFGRLGLASFLIACTFACVTLAADPVAPERVAINDPRVYSDQKPGSVLIFNYYTSKVANPKGQNTEITITNTHPSLATSVHLFFVAFNCTVADSIVCLAPNQTATFLTSDVDPEVSGYIVAYAIDREAGCPISFNHLIGSESVKLETGHAANLSAVSVSAIYQGKLAGCNKDNPFATMQFDGLQYNQLPRVLAVDKLRSPADDNATLLVVNSLNGNLAIAAQPLRNLDGDLFNDVGTGYSFTRPCACGMAVPLDNNFPVTEPSFAHVIPAGRTGWLKLKARQELVIGGTVINFNAKQVERNAAFNGGHNLHHLELTATSFIAPVFAHMCIGAN